MIDGGMIKALYINGFFKTWYYCTTISVLYILFEWFRYVWMWIDDNTEYFELLLFDDACAELGYIGGLLTNTLVCIILACFISAIWPVAIVLFSIYIPMYLLRKLRRYMKKRKKSHVERMKELEVDAKNLEKSMKLDKKLWTI